MLIYLLGLTALSGVVYLWWHGRQLRLAEEERARMAARLKDKIAAMVHCPQCGVYVAPEGAGSCGKPDCPFPPRT